MLNNIPNNSMYTTDIDINYEYDAVCEELDKQQYTEDDYNYYYENGILNTEFIDNEEKEFQDLIKNEPKQMVANHQ